MKMSASRIDHTLGAMWDEKFRGTIKEYLMLHPGVIKPRHPPIPQDHVRANLPPPFPFGPHGGIGTFGWQYDQEVIKEGIRAGAAFLDTAPGYGFGKVEKALGSFLGGWKWFPIATKVSRTHMRYKSVVAACERSLANLKREVIDLYQIHWPNPEVPIEETMQAMVDLQKAGKILHIGVCNFSAGMLEAAQAALPSGVYIRSNQIRFNPLDRIAEVGLIPYCRRCGIQVIAYSPLGQNFARIRAVTPYATTAFVLQWIRSKGLVPIPRSNSAVHARENQHVVEIHPQNLLDFEANFPQPEI